MNAMSEMGEEGITVQEATASASCAPGKGDNTALEYTLAGYAFYVTQPGKESARARGQLPKHLVKRWTW